MNIIGRIKENGEIVHEFFGQGLVYKNWTAFENKSEEICYAGEHTENVSEAYNYNDFLRIAKKFMKENDDFRENSEGSDKQAHDIAENLFFLLDWQTPETMIEEWESQS